MSTITVTITIYSKMIHLTEKIILVCNLHEIIQSYMHDFSDYKMYSILCKMLQINC